MIIKNCLRVLVIGAFFVAQTTTFARSNKAVARHVHKKIIQETSFNHPQSNTQKQVVQKKFQNLGKE